MELFDRASTVSVLAAEGSEGGGTAIHEIIALTVAGGIVAAILLWIGWMHRQHKISWLTSLADWTGRRFKRPSWVALPVALFTASIICALFGFIWDVSLHIGNGRDDGALAHSAGQQVLRLEFDEGCGTIPAPVQDRIHRLAELGAAAVFGIATALMNLLFYLAIDRLPLGKGVAIEFIGPIAVAATIA